MQRRRNFASSSDGRSPKRLKKRGVSQGSTANATPQAPAKINVFTVNGANMKPSASTVARSVMKQAASTVLPYSVLFKPNSSITEYTTATEVVDMAMPASQLAGPVQPSRK